jgi:hypothetical protein
MPRCPKSWVLVTPSSMESEVVTVVAMPGLSAEQRRGPESSTALKFTSEFVFLFSGTRV